MKKQLSLPILIMFCLWYWADAFAIPANPKTYAVEQPDGTTIHIRLCGDEYYHYYTTEDGVPVTLCEDGFYRYTTIDAQNNLVASTEVVGKNQTSVLPDKKSIMIRHNELYKVNKMKRVVNKQNVQAPIRNVVKNATAKDGKAKGIIVLAEFQDQKFTFSQNVINDMMNKEGYTDEYGSIGSARDYFVAQSYGQFQPEFDVVGPITLSQDMAYYGANNDNGNDIRPHVMVAEACQLASEQGLVDMSDYDKDGDGWVDLVYVIYAGYPESSGADSSTIWPHAWYVYLGGGLQIMIDGVMLDAYACSAELQGNSGLNPCGIGTFCHEFSHTLGLPDWYDIDYSGAMGMSWWSIMNTGSYGVNGYVPVGYNAYERELCGWLEFNELTEDASITMPELNTDKTAAYKITSTNANQYITLETRRQKGWDVALPSEGMMVIAIDYDKNAWNRNGPNDDPSRQRFKLIPADNQWDEETLEGDLYPYSGNTTLSSFSSPKMRVHNTIINGKTISGITYNNGVTTFNFEKVAISSNEVPTEIEGLYNAFANSGFKNQPNEEWKVNISIDETEKGKVWIQPICMFADLETENISPVYATYNAANNTLIMPLGQTVFEDSFNKLVIAQTIDGSDKNITDNIVLHINNSDSNIEISFANDYILGVGDILNDEWWYQAIYNISYTKTTPSDDEADEVPTEIEGLYNAFANSGFKNQPNEEWKVNISIDETEKGKVWIQPICMFADLETENISPVYATYNAANNTLIMPLGQTVFEDSFNKLVIAQTIDGSDKNITDNIVLHINNSDSNIEISFANDYILGVGDILNDEWWYQAIYNISYTKTTPSDDEADEVPTEIEGLYNAFANSGFKNQPNEEWKVNISIDETEKGKVWIQPICMFADLETENISPVYATYNAANNTLIMPLGQTVFEDSFNKLVIAQTIDGSDKNITDNIVLHINNSDSNIEISFANDYILGVGDILNDEWWYQAIYNISYTKTTPSDDEADEVPTEIEGLYNAFANSGFKNQPNEEWKVNISIDETEKGKVWIQPICMFADLETENISPVYATYNAANNTLIMPLGQTVFEDSFNKLVIAQTIDGSDKNITDNIVLHINNSDSNIEISFANDYILGVGDILNDEWWYQAIYNISYTKTTLGEEIATSIALNKSEISLETTQTATLVATVLPTTTTNKAVTWKSSNNAVATVDAYGMVTAVGIGEAIISATTTDGSDLSATCKVIVIPTLAISIELDKTDVSIEEKSDLQLTATILPEHTTNKEVAWNSSDKWIASVDNNGLVTIYSAGEVIITATTTDGSNLSATCHINVYSSVNGVCDNNAIVATVGDNIVVNNAPLESVINLYSSNGALIKSEIATDGSIAIKVPLKGIYVVTIENQTFKVIVK